MFPLSISPHRFALESDGTLLWITPGQGSDIVEPNVATVTCSGGSGTWTFTSSDGSVETLTITISLENGGCEADPSAPDGCENPKPEDEEPEPPENPGNGGGGAFWGAVRPWEDILPPDFGEIPGDDTGGGGGACGSGPNESGSPVSLLNGHKIERSTDLSVRLPGRDFIFTREYSSDQSLYSTDSQGDWFWNGRWDGIEPGYIGVRWSSPLFSQITSDSGTTDTQLYVIGENLQSRRKYVKVGAQPVLTASGGSNSYIERGTLDAVAGFSGSFTVDVWRLREPGGGERVYLARDTSYPTQTGSAGIEFDDLVGLVLEDRDQFGNTWQYEWTSLGTNSVGGRENVRLDTIHLKDEAGTTLARVQFDWNGESGTPYSSVALNAAGEHYYGRLAEVSVERADSGSWVTTQSARYLYFDDLALTDDSFMGSTYGSSQSLANIYDGSKGDLCEVVISKLLDGDFDGDSNPDFHDTVTQYRYYTGNTSFSRYDLETVLDGANDWAFRGEAHQLMSVLYPTQIEYYADVVRRAADGVRGDTTAIDDLIYGEASSSEAQAIFDQLYPSSGVFSSATEAAERLRWVGFYTDPVEFHEQSGALLFPNDEWSTLLDLSGKVIRYYTTADAMHGEEGRVRTQLLSTENGSCGCSGASGTPFSLGKRIDYLYTRYKYDTSPTRPVTLSDEFNASTDGYTCQLVESFVDSTSPLNYEPYRVLCHDYFWATSFGEGEVYESAANRQAASSGVYRMGFAVCEADSGWDFDPYSSTTVPILSAGKRWATVPLYDLTTDPVGSQFNSYRKLIGRLDIEAVDSSPTGYEPASGFGSTVSAPIIPTTSSSGRVTHFAYTDGYLSSIKDSVGSSGTQETIATISNSEDRPDLVSSVTSPIDGTNSQSSTAEYGYYDSTNTTDPNGAVLAWSRTSTPSEPMAQNGPDATVQYARFTMFDKKGQVRWIRDEVGTLTYFEYDGTTGAQVLSVQDADPNGTYVDLDAELPGDFPGLTLSTEWSLPSRSDYAELQTSTTPDLLGRTIKTTDPAGVIRYTRRELRSTDTVISDGSLAQRGVPFKAWIELPHQLSSGSFNGPISVEWMNAGGQSLRSSQYVALASGGTYNPESGTYQIGDEVARSDSELRLNGAEVRSRQWHRIGVTAQSSSDAFTNDGSYMTTTEYDARGRAYKMTDAEGGVTQTVFDLLGRPIESLRGTVSSTPIVVSRMFYDHTLDGMSMPVHGTGNGNLTYTEYNDGTHLRVTERWFDYRNRLIGQKNPVAPHQVFKYDNLGRAVSTASFTSDSGFGSGAPGSLPDADLASLTRSTYSQTLYNTRGMMYRSLQAIDPTGVTSSDSLQSDSWFDGAGRVVASWSPSTAGTKTEFDALGRPSVTYVTNRYDDAIPGAAGTHADALSVTDDHVVMQVEYAYVANGKPGAGATELVATRMRLHDHPETTDGDGPLDATNAVTAFVLSEFDDASRMIRQHNYGTNDTVNGAFIANTSAPSRPSVTSGAPDGGALVSEVGFDSWGRTVSQTSPGGRTTLTVLDPLSRQIAVVEAQSNVTETHIELGASDWSVNWSSAYPSPASPSNDADRVTTFLYDGLSNVVRRTAHLPDGTSQSTQYVYGTVTTGSGVTASQIASSHLLAKVHYPDETTGGPNTAAEYTVSYGYNRLGELTGITDQNGTSHAYTLDTAGRITSDVATPASGNPVGLDLSVDEITTAYDNHGRVTDIKSLSSSTVVNAVQFDYTPLHQIDTMVQDNHGDIGGPNDYTSEYTYTNAVASAGGGNYSRLTSIRYPAQSSGDTVSVEYGAFGSISDRISRADGMDVTGWAVGSDELVDYDYLGQSIPVRVSYPATSTTSSVGVSLDYIKNHDGTDGSLTDRYFGFDQYGRIVWQGWVNEGFSPRSGFAGLPDRTPLIARRYEYDADSNRVRDYDGRPGGVGPIPADRDWIYQYDDLERLETAYRGQQTPGTGTPGSVNEDFTVSAGSVDWGLDILGNWDTVSDDSHGVWPVVWSNNAIERENRTHNMANELLSRSNPGPGGSVSIITQPSYDAAGNIADNWPVPSTPIALTYTHDMWNRLVRVEKSSDGTDVLENEYNGLNWRTKRGIDLSQSSYDGIDEERTYYYSPSWQLLEEHVDSDLLAEANPADRIDRKAQQFWGLRYIDDAVARRIDRDNDGTWSTSPVDNFLYLTDVMFSVRGVADNAGNMHTRLDYTPYGVAKHRYAADITGDGLVNFFDIQAFQAAYNSGSPLQPGDAGYNPNADLNGDNLALGFVFEYGAYIARYNAYSAGGANPTVNDGWIDNLTDINGPDSSVGYHGYVFDLAGQPGESGGLYLSRHRYYAPEEGRWLARDPLGHVDGLNVYSFVGQNPIGYTDFLGLYRRILTKGGPDLNSDGSHLYAVDGTWSDRIPGLQFGTNTRRFYTSYAGKFARYVDGPSSGMTGSDALGIANRMKEWVCKDFCRQSEQCKPFVADFVGWSRGAALLMHMLNDIGFGSSPCSCPHDEGKPVPSQRLRLRFAGFFDAVDMTLPGGLTGGLSVSDPNVRNVYKMSHAVKTSTAFQQSNMFPTMNTSRNTMRFDTFANTPTTHGDIGTSLNNGAMAWIVWEAQSVEVPVR